MNPAHAQLLREGLLLQQRGRSAEAEVIFRKLLKQDPQQADGWRLLGLIELARGDLLAAGQSLGHSLRLRADHPQAWHGLGEVHEESGRPADAEACYRRAGELKPDWAEAHYNQARMLHRLGQLEAAHQPLQLCLRFKPAMVGAWQLQAMLEQAAGAMDAALLSLDRALQLAPGRAALHHNRAVVLQCSHQHALALQAHEQAQALGLDMADAHYNHGNTLFSLGQPAAAAAAYRKALARDPQHALAQYDLAKLRWSQGEADFLGELEAAEQAAPQSAIPCGIKAGLLLKAECYQDAAAAFERACLLAPQVAAYFDGFGQALCQLGQFDAALQAHQQALTLSPRDATLHCHQARCLLAAGFAQQAAAAAGQAVILAPDDQQAWALLGLAWRLLGDPREALLNDYARLVRVFDLPAPPEFADMACFNEALSAELTALHTDREAPVDQTLRHGTQTRDNLLDQGRPMVDRLKPLLGQAIDQYIEELPTDADHPFLRRRSQAWQFTDSWSSRLRSSGFHTNHVHGHGWISACYYVAVPPAVEDAVSKAGWLKFGEPDLALGLDAARLVQPRPGRLVLFPSCFWHGTLPFSDEKPRLTIAFDIKPLMR